MLGLAESRRSDGYWNDSFETPPIFPPDMRESLCFEPYTPDRVTVDEILMPGSYRRLQSFGEDKSKVANFLMTKSVDDSLAREYRRENVFTRETHYTGRANAHVLMGDDKRRREQAEHEYEASTLRVMYGTMPSSSDTLQTIDVYTPIHAYVNTYHRE